MGHPIVKRNGKYQIYSTIAEGFITEPMTERELRVWIKEEYGNEGLRELPKRLERVKEHGRSDIL